MRIGIFIISYFLFVLEGRTPIHSHSHLFTCTLLSEVQNSICRIDYSFVKLLSLHILKIIQHIHEIRKQFGLIKKKSLLEFYFLILAEIQIFKQFLKITLLKKNQQKDLSGKNKISNLYKSTLPEHFIHKMKTTKDTYVQMNNLFLLL